MSNLFEKKREALGSPFFYTYLITDPNYYGDDLSTFEKKLSEVLENFSIDMVCFRDKKTTEIRSLAKVCLEVSKKHKIKKVLMNGDIELASDLGFEGVHLTSKQFDKITYAKSLGLYTIISTHSEDEIIIAKQNKADAITFSPIFFKENKGEPKGCESLSRMVQKYQDSSFEVYALGGITTPTQLALVKQTHCKGFASISYFF